MFGDTGRRPLEGRRTISGPTGEKVPRSGAGRRREPKVPELVAVLAFHKDVARLEVEVHEAPRVEQLQREQHLAQERPEALRLGREAAAADAALQGRGAELRLDEEPLVLDPGLVVAHDVPQALGAAVARRERREREDFFQRAVSMQRALEARVRGLDRVPAGDRARARDGRPRGDGFRGVLRNIRAAPRGGAATHPRRRNS